MAMDRSKGWKAGFIGIVCAALTACGLGENSGGPQAGSEAADGGITVVSMTVMTKDRFLAEAEQKFEAAHPDIDIRIEETVPQDPQSEGKMMISKQEAGRPAGPTAEQVDKYVNAVNTAIMSGKAADIISVDRLPSEKYAGKGLLADWSGLADQDKAFQQSDYYENVLSGVSFDGGWYGIPVSLSLNVMVGDKSVLEQSGLDDKTWTWDQFVQLLEEQGKIGDGQYGIAMVRPEELLAYLTETVYEQLVAADGKSVSFDEETFRGYMEKVKRLYDSGLATAEMPGAGASMFRQVEMQHPVELAMIPKLKGGENETMLRPPGTGRDEGIPFKSDQVLALNANSDVKESAWEFVKFLLSEEMQSSSSLMGFPVHRAALETKLKDMQEKMAGGEAKMTIKGPNGEGGSVQLTDEDIEQIVSVMPSVGKYGNRDAKVLNMIREESAAYFSGSKTSEAVAGLLDNRIETYLNE
ncbi:ABC transporter substrate-binding protein [Paenibacillus thailandensis]|uniref:ABC transporter substrate-binding protein n=1 Tax=Paenibacillus thailandensis TaxID=393250 RepID=A0ABW5R145_9BACL